MNYVFLTKRSVLERERHYVPQSREGAAALPLPDAFSNDDSYSADAQGSVSPDLCQHFGVEGRKSQWILFAGVSSRCSWSAETLH